MSSYYVGDATKIEGYLKHYGVPGQSWGKRRYQNPDGSLTAEGRAHYGVGDPRGKKGRFKLFNNKKEAAAFAGGVIPAAALAGVGYLGYRALRNRNKNLINLGVRNKNVRRLGQRLLGSGSTKVLGSGNAGLLGAGKAGALAVRNGGLARTAKKAGSLARASNMSNFRPRTVLNPGNDRLKNFLKVAGGAAAAAGAGAGGVAYYKNRKNKQKKKRS